MGTAVVVPRLTAGYGGVAVLPCQKKARKTGGRYGVLPYQRRLGIEFQRSTTPASDRETGWSSRFSV
jgi:hypothetical protein